MVGQEETQCVVVLTCSVRHLCGFVCPSEHSDQDRPTCLACGRTAALPGRGLYLDARLRGLWLRLRRLLLATRCVGAGAGTRLPLDSGVLGLGRRPVYFPSRLLGPASWLLRRNQLWLRVFRQRLRRRALGPRPLFLQPFREQCERYQHPQRLQHDRDQQHARQSRELQRRQRRNRCAPDAGRRSCGTRETRPPRNGSNATCASGANQPGTTGLVKPRRPPVAATPRPGAFNERGAVPGRETGAPYRPEAHRGAEQPRGNTSVPRPENNVPAPLPQCRQRTSHPRVQIHTAPSPITTFFLARMA